jgi:hypothetical protein
MTFALVALGSDRVLVSVSARSSWLEWSLDDLISLGWRRVATIQAESWLAARALVV